MKSHLMMPAVTLLFLFGSVGVNSCWPHVQSQVVEANKQLEQGWQEVKKQAQADAAEAQRQAAAERRREENHDFMQQMTPWLIAGTVALVLVGGFVYALHTRSQMPPETRIVHVPQAQPPTVYRVVPTTDPQLVQAVGLLAAGQAQLAREQAATQRLLARLLMDLRRQPQALGPGVDLWDENGERQ